MPQPDDTRNAGNGDASPKPTQAGSNSVEMKSASGAHHQDTKFVNKDCDVKGNCIHYDEDSDSDSEGNGTANAENDMETDTPTVQVIVQEIDQHAIRKSLAFMIIVDGLPFAIVEHEGFRRFTYALNPGFCIPSRLTVARDCYRLYLSEKLKLKKFFRSTRQRVCLTTERWSSLKKLNYMCLTAHFIDNDWKLNRKVLNFFPVCEDKGKAIGEAINDCLLEWGIDDIFTVTVDKENANDDAIDHLKKMIDGRGHSILQGKYLHMKCIAHITKLIVVDLLTEFGESVERIRNAVRYMKEFPYRLAEFKECLELEGIEDKCLLPLDVTDNWSSTYLMLEAAQKFEKGFERYEKDYKYFRSDLQEINEDGLAKDGAPTSSDWANARRLLSFLQQFYKLALRVSRPSHVTSNIFFEESTTLQFLLEELQSSEDPELSRMASCIREKYNKYWGYPEEMNKLIHIAVVLDPRFKLGYMEFALSEMYKGERGLFFGKQVKKAVYALLNEYGNLVPPQSSQSNNNFQTSTESSVENLSSAERVKRIMESRYERFRSSMGSADGKAELNRYLNDPLEEYSVDFDILGWWKLNGTRFPILSDMARDVLAVPISAVTSESIFNPQVQVLDLFRSSLTFKTVEALICAQNWLRKSPPVPVEEDMEEMEEPENELLEFGPD